jgi:hypothetical protein
MCQRSDTVTGKIEHCTGFDRKQLQEIDIRVGARLMERELLRSEYIRGILDCFYFLLFVGLGIYIWFSSKEE